MADEKKTYTLTTATVPARPRSKTRREGEGLTTGVASAIVESATAGNAQRAAHSETANEAAHAAEATHALNADNAKNATHADEATHTAHAETATSATTSEHSNAADTATRAQSAQTADHAATAATADRAIHATEAETLRTPNYSDGLTTGAGARIDATGNAEFQSMAVRGFFRAAEYQINRIALSEGDVFHTENGLVKSAEQQPDGRWKVVLQERFQGDVTGFRAGDVLRGAYNSVGTAGGAAEIRTSWLRVEAVDAQAGTLTASLYADNQTPEGRNAPPVPLMRLARWGNTTDPERQSHIMESATDGRIVRRVKVSAPIVDGTQSDGFVVGKLPAWLREHFGAAVAGASDYVFARGIITQNILRYTPAGRPLAERVDRGLWSASARYFYEEQNPETGAFEISRVWHDGALYELARGGNGNTTPAAQSTHWTLIQAKPKDGAAGKSAPSTGANLIDGTSFRSMEEVRRWEHFDRFTFDTSQTDRVHPLAQAVCALKDLNWIKGSLKIAGLLRPNTTYTISIYSKGAPGVLAVHYSALPGTSRYVSCNNVDRNKWKRHTYTFTTTDIVPDNANIFLGCTDMLAKTYFSALKLEEGEEATAWCLSENDKTGTPAANPNLWHCTDYVTRPHFTTGYLNKNPYASILPGGVDGDNYFHIEGNNEERVAHVVDQPFGNRYPRGTWYTISFKCRGSGSARFHCYPGGWKKKRYYFPRIKSEGIDGIGQGYLILYFRLTKEWVTHSLSFFYDEEEDDLPKLLRTQFSLPKSEGNYLDICHPKMETGEFVTPWCLSEMDKKGDRGEKGERGERGERGEKGEPGIRGLQGLQGERGERGIPGERGADGRSSYTHIAYAADKYGRDMSQAPSGDLPFIGMYCDEVPEDSNDPKKYTWTKYIGRDGATGLPGRDGTNGETAYLHIAYSNDKGWKDFSVVPVAGKTYEYIGTYTDHYEEDSKEFSRYKWTKIKGEPGKDGAKGEPGEKGEPGAKGERGVPGEKGDNGRGIDRIETFYLLTPDGTAPEDDARGWRNTAPVPTPQTPWLWTYERVVYSDGTSVRTPVRLDTRLAKNGADAEPMRPNLLDGTDFRQLGRTESAWKIGTHGEEPVAGRANISIFSSAVDGCVPALCAINPGTKEGEFAQLFQNVGQLIPGRTYTFSAYVRGADVAWLIVYPTPAEHFHPNTVKQDGWTRVSLTFRAPAVQDPDGVLLLLRAWHRETTPHTGYAKSVVWCAPKLEEGGGPTPWCPSFRDQRGADGSPGVRGAAVRLLGDYDRLADGTPFESGHAGETYLDVVQVRQGAQVQFYQCKQPHAKSADKAPAADSEWWELGTYQGFVATDLLLARRSLIKNLQVENVVGRDKRGNATFELDAETGAAYIGGTATFAGFIRRRPVVITPENWKEYGGEMGRNGDVFYLNPFAVGTYVIFRGNFGALRPTIDTSNLPLAEGREELTNDNSHLMRYYGAQFMVFNDTPTSLFIGDLNIPIRETAVFTMLGCNSKNVTLWWKGEIVKRW